MTISAISAVSGTTPTGYIDSASAVAGGGSVFATTIGDAVNEAQGLKGTSDALAIKAVTGDLKDVHQATIASTRAQMTLELVAGIRNKAVDSFNEIMRLQA